MFMEQKPNKTKFVFLALFSVVLIALFVMGTSKKQEEFSEISALEDTGQKSEDNGSLGQGLSLDENWISRDFSDFGNVFEFRASYPMRWRIQENKQNQTINIFDPKISPKTELDQSQIFIEIFQGDDPTSNNDSGIEELQEFELHNRPAALYQTRAGAQNSQAGLPDWKKQDHFVVQIPSSPLSPQVFFTLSKNPDLSDDIFLRFAESISFYNDQSALFPPLAGWRDRISKKPFGIEVSPQNSPIQPEIFSGFHTGADFEVRSEEKLEQIPVHAVCNGEIVMRDSVSGYGGTVVQRCGIRWQPFTVVYGHLSFEAEFAKDEGTYLTAGQIFAILADENSEQSGGERKHLHLSVHRGHQTDLRGYVENEQELENWIDPEKLIEK